LGKKAKKTTKAPSKNGAKKQQFTYLGVVIALVTLIMFCSFIDVNGKNMLGPFGDCTASFLYIFLGRAAYILPFILGFYSLNIFRNDPRFAQKRFMAGFVLIIISFSLLITLFAWGSTMESFQTGGAFAKKTAKAFWDSNPAFVAKDKMGGLGFYLGGYIGFKSVTFLAAWFNVIGAYIIVAMLLAAAAVLFGKEELLFQAGRIAHEAAAKALAMIIEGAKTAADIARNMASGAMQKRAPAEGVEEENEENEKETAKDKKAKEKEAEKEKKKQAKNRPVEEEEIEEPENKKPAKRDKLNVISSEEPVEKKSLAIQAVVKGDYTLPSIDFLKGGTATPTAEKKDYTEDADKLKKTLKDFGVDAEVVNVVDGPVIARFEVELATGTKVSRVQNLAEDIALAMMVEQVRIAPVPNKSLLGIEIPKKNKKMITLKEIIEHKEFQEATSLLTMAMGRDIGGKPIIAELGKMPHLLIAGATGSGKSVCINTIIMSILYKASPDEVKLVLVDPKRVELTHYRDIPHLITQVITDPKHAAYVLKKLTDEMDYRYDMLSKEGARDIATYNKMVADFNAALKADSEATEDLKKSLPYIVLIIDELADLMTLAKQNVESSLQRLAQLARAVGIHIVLATQRPSVDVITGVIKANFPSRIAFQVMSKVDSRTILDMNGADALLGRGDMLYAPADISKPLRGQAAFVSTEEISKVVHFCKKQRKPDISPEFDFKNDDPDLEGGGEGGTGGDELMKKAIELAKAKGNISTSYLQRKLGIGYSKAARLIDDMEEKGIVTGADGNKPREYTGK
jgi:S-DNA-T family DNA segregation ATPase FtsK/SpoIIIE